MSKVAQLRPDFHISPLNNLWCSHKEQGIKKVSNGVASSLGCLVRPGDELAKINSKMLSRDLGFEEIIGTKQTRKKKRKTGTKWK